jgi:SH3-like domain-containing protein
MQKSYEVQVIKEYCVEYSEPIKVAAGACVHIGREDAEFPGWRWCGASDGRAGWVPVELLSEQGMEATIIEDYSAQELAVTPEEEVTVEASRQEWLWVRNARGERGWIPAAHAKEL